MVSPYVFPALYRGFNNPGKEIITNTILEYFSIDMKTLIKRSRKPAIFMPRWMCVILLRKYTDMSLHEVRRFLELKDHTALMHTEVKFWDYYYTDEIVKQDYDNIVKKLTSNG